MRPEVTKFFRQFGHPEGGLGAIATLVMAVENRRTNQRLVELAKVERGDRALDVGCGPGVAVRYAARISGASVTGVDASRTAISVAKALTATRPGLRFEVASSEALPFADGDFTVAWAMNSLHHWADRAAGLRELHRVIEHGGRLVIGERRPSPDAGTWSPPGMKDDALADLLVEIKAAGFTDITSDEEVVDKDRFAVVTASPS